MSKIERTVNDEAMKLENMEAENYSVYGYELSSTVIKEIRKEK